MALIIDNSYQYKPISLSGGDTLSTPTAGAGAGAGMSSALVPMMAIGAIGSAFGAYYQAKTQKIQLSLQADIARINARVAERTAQTTLLAGQRQEQGARLSTAQLKSGQRARMAARGIDLASDTATNILTTTDVMGEIDANTIQANAVRAAWGYRTEGVNSQISARMADANARGISPGSAATSSLLGNATSLASNYYTLKKAGAFG